MVMINGKAPVARPSSAPLRVVVKLATGARAPEEASGTSEEILSLVRRHAADAPLRPYFEEHLGKIRAVSSAPFDRYHAVAAPDAKSAEELVQRLRGLQGVEEAYVEGGPCPPPVNPSDDPRSADQGYLGAAPAGIDARWAWSACDGQGIGFVDLERGWTLNHEDLAAAGITLISGENQDYRGHGTAVLGEVVGVDNDKGGIGIAPRASARVVSQWRADGSYNTAAAILSAQQAMSRGDVLLLEAQTNYNGYSLVPVEVEPAVFDAIRHAVDAGIVVVEAGANGGNDLDAYRDASNRHSLDRGSPDFRDSGAILVGAGSSAAPHARLGFSNYGSRVDCYAWGENIVTTGDGWTGDSTTAYTSGFGGTSGATPMIAGAALLLQSWRKPRAGQVYDPGSLRDLLSSTALGNTPSANPAADRIGVMPDLRAILESEAASPYRVKLDDYLAFIYILFGILNDAPGLVWIPGKGPVPVDPGFGRAPVALDGPRRDLLTHLLVHELASRVADGASGRGLAGTAIAGMRRAVDELGRAG